MRRERTSNLRYEESNQAKEQFEVGEDAKNGKWKFHGGLTSHMGLQEGITSPFRKVGLPESMLLGSESLWLPIPILEGIDQERTPIGY